MTDAAQLDGGRATGCTAGRAHRQRVGQLGEDAAVRYLTATGLTVVDRNWRAEPGRDGLRGEIDVVAVDAGGAGGAGGPVLVVCEVKTRTSTRYGEPEEAVTWRKARRLRRLAAAWLRSRRRALPPGAQLPRTVRVDVIAVLAVPGQPVHIHHLTGVG